MLCALLALGAAATLPCGTTEHVLVVNNYPRTYRVHNPQSVCNTGGATAMLMCLHGWQQDAAWACDAM